MLVMAEPIKTTPKNDTIKMVRTEKLCLIFPFCLPVFEDFP